MAARWAARAGVGIPGALPLEEGWTEVFLGRFLCARVTFLQGTGTCLFAGMSEFRTVTSLHHLPQPRESCPMGQQVPFLQEGLWVARYPEAQVWTRAGSGLRRPAEQPYC